MDVCSVFLTCIIKIKVLALLGDIFLPLEGIKPSRYWDCHWEKPCGRRHNTSICLVTATEENFWGERLENREPSEEGGKTQDFDAGMDTIDLERIKTKQKRTVGNHKRVGECIRF